MISILNNIILQLEALKAIKAFFDEVPELDRVGLDGSNFIDDGDNVFDGELIINKSRYDDFYDSQSYRAEIDEGEIIKDPLTDEQRDKLFKQLEYLALEHGYDVDIDMIITRDQIAQSITLIENTLFVLNSLKQSL